MNIDIVVIKDPIEHIVGISRNGKEKISIGLDRGTELPVGEKDHFHKQKRFFVIWIAGYKFKIPTEWLEFEKFWWN